MVSFGGGRLRRLSEPDPPEVRVGGTRHDRNGRLRALTNSRTATPSKSGCDTKGGLVRF
jgi:hypothetical protein